MLLILGLLAGLPGWGRAAKPLPVASEVTRRMIERSQNRMAGKVWIDEADADTARIEVGLVEPLSLGWFGWLGSLNRCEMSLERQRMPDGVWINTKQSLLIQCRKLTAKLRFRTTEVGSGFQKVAAKR